MSPILSEPEGVSKGLHPGAGLGVNEMRDRNEITGIELDGPVRVTYSGTDTAAARRPWRRENRLRTSGPRALRVPGPGYRVAWRACRHSRRAPHWPAAVPTLPTAQSY